MPPTKGDPSRPLTPWREPSCAESAPSAAHTGPSVRPHSQWGAAPPTVRPTAAKAPQPQRGSHSPIRGTSGPQSSGDQGDCISEPTGHLLPKATLPGHSRPDSHTDTNAEATKVGRQRNRPQVEQQGKSPGKELNETEASKLPDTEFQAPVTRKLKDLARTPTARNISFQHPSAESETPIALNAWRLF